MEKSVLIIITGLPGTGKTSLGKKIADQYKLPFITRDAIKERLFDVLGWSDRAWSKKLGQVSYVLMDFMIEAILSTGRSLIVESNFKPEYDNAKFKDWQVEYHYQIIQLVLSSQGEILLKRFKKRVASGERHPGHVDQVNYTNAEFKALLLSGLSEPLDISGEVIKIDTTDFSVISYEEISALIKKSLG